MKKTYLVYRFIHGCTPNRYTLKVIVKNATSEEEVRKTCQAAGLVGISEFGIPWANHHITDLKNADISLLGQLDSGHHKAETIDAVDVLTHIEMLRNLDNI